MNIRKTNPLTKTVTKISGEFISRDMRNIHATQTAYEWTAEAVAALAESPDEGNWFKLADRLEEEGNPACHIIRAVFVDGYEPPAGFTGSVGRSGHYHENGSNYSEGLGVEWKDAKTGHEGAGLYHTYWANGNFTRTITVEEARDMLTTTNYRRACRWSDVAVRGSVPTTGAVLPVGSKVKVRKAGGLLRGESYKEHETTTAVTVPLDDCHISYEASNTKQTILFEYMGFDVFADLSAVEMF